MVKKKETKPESQVEEPNIEDLKRENIILRGMLSEKHRIEELERTKVRLTFMFKVLEFANQFPMEYVRDVANDIQSEMPAGAALQKMQQEEAARAAAAQQKAQGGLHVVQPEGNEQ